MSNLRNMLTESQVQYKQSRTSSLCAIMLSCFHQIGMLTQHANFTWDKGQLHTDAFDY